MSPALVPEVAIGVDLQYLGRSFLLHEPREMRHRDRARSDRRDGGTAGGNRLGPHADGRQVLKKSWMFKEFLAKWQGIMAIQGEETWRCFCQINTSSESTANHDTGGLASKQMKDHSG